jgi:DnaJ-domain-containing protein 1
MAQKHPSWTRTRIGRNRFHWVAYDDRIGSDGCQVVDQGYAASLAEADASAREALAAAGMYQARRMSPNFRKSTREESPRRSRSAKPLRERLREYLYTRQLGESDENIIAAHMVLRKTAKRVYVTRRSCGVDQLGTEDERWEENESVFALDRIKLERDGSVYSSNHRLSDFFASREAALGDSPRPGEAAFRLLGIQPPCSLEDIKAAYRRKALEVHPDRGGSPADFQAVEAAYRRLHREAHAPEC